MSHSREYIQKYGELDNNRTPTKRAGKKFIDKQRARRDTKLLKQARNHANDIR